MEKDNESHVPGNARDDRQVPVLRHDYGLVNFTIPPREVVVTEIKASDALLKVQDQPMSMVPVFSGAARRVHASPILPAAPHQVRPRA
jgi:hypothetical protein